MYHAETDTPAMARTSNLNEELGQVSCLMVHIDIQNSTSGCSNDYQCLRNNVHAHVLCFPFHFKHKSDYMYMYMFYMDRWLFCLSKFLWSVNCSLLFLCRWSTSSQIRLGPSHGTSWCLKSAALLEYLMGKS